MSAHIENAIGALAGVACIAAPFVVWFVRGG